MNILKAMGFQVCMILLTVTLTMCSRSNHADHQEANLTKIYSDSVMKHPRFVTIVKVAQGDSGLEYETLISKHRLKKNEKVDLYWTWKNIRIPYYMPARSIYRDSFKDRSCDWSKYPANVSCYAYDHKNRVIKMNIEGSGTSTEYNFTYTDKDQIDSIKDHSYPMNSMKYSVSGNLLLIKNVRESNFDYPDIEFRYDY